MTNDRPIGPDEVEAFFSRQRREILGRLDEPAVAGEGHDPSPARPGRWWPALAAAAALILAAAALLWTPAPPGPETPDALPDAFVVEVPPSLRAFGPWTEPNSPAEEAERPEGLSWLLDDEPTYPDFLEPFGLWAEMDVASPEST